LKREKRVPLTQNDQQCKAHRVQEIVTNGRVISPKCFYTYHQSVFRLMLECQWSRRGKYREWADEVTEEFMLLFCSRSGPL